MQYYQVPHILRHLVSYPYAAVILSSAQLFDCNLLEQDNQQLSEIFNPSMFSIALDTIFGSSKESCGSKKWDDSKNEVVINMDEHNFSVPVRFRLIHENHETNIIVIDDDAYIIDHVRDAVRVLNCSFPEGCFGLRVTDLKSVERIVNSIQDSQPEQFDLPVYKFLIGENEESKCRYDGYLVQTIELSYVKDDVTFSEYLNMITNHLALVREELTLTMSNDVVRMNAILENLNDNYQKLRDGIPKAKIVEVTLD